MKSTLITALVLTSFAAFSQSTKLFIESSAGSAGIVSNNTQVPDRHRSPMMRTAVGYDNRNLRIGAVLARTEYGYSNSTYSVSTVGLAGGYTIDLDHFGLSVDAIFDYRLASLQRVGGQQITSGSLSPVDLVLRPSVFVRPIKTNQSVELVVGYELGLLDLDPADASTGISAKHRALTIGARVIFKEPVTPSKSNSKS